jgi:hypothetical protein
MGLARTLRPIKNSTPPPIRTIQVNVRTHPNARARTTRGLQVAGEVAGPAKAEIGAKVGVVRGTGAGGGVGAHAIRKVAPVARTATAKMMADRSRSN